MGKWTTIAEAAIEVLAKKSGGALPAAQPTSGSGDAMVDVLRPIDENSLLWLSQQPVGRMPPGRLRSCGRTVKVHFSALETLHRMRCKAQGWTAMPRTPCGANCSGHKATRGAASALLTLCRGLTYCRLSRRYRGERPVWTGAGGAWHYRLDAAPGRWICG
jgi:hypothetical protein